ncbi:hypothetical protein ABLE92_24950 [Gordonia sp. VNQ95]|jgi:hypothetical protein|uniref:hypothetical protein n=1 Tax=Gordonia TaxID=2053 RepID=UPI0032B55837
MPHEPRDATTAVRTDGIAERTRRLSIPMSSRADATALLDVDLRNLTDVHVRPVM